MDYKNFGFIASKIKSSEKEQKFLISKGCIEVESIQDIKKNKIQLLFVLGGDGFMLRTLHKFINYDIDFYGINCGTHGFLLNNHKSLENKSLEQIIKNSKKYTINPLKAKITNIKGIEKTVYAINEISLLRSTHNAAHIKIIIENQERLPKLISDGIIVATPAGSTAYNLSLNGPILPLDCNFVAVTPISPFRPKLWKGAIINNNKKIEFKVLDSKTRTVSTTADFIEFKNTLEVEISVDHTKKVNLLFNTDENIDEKIISQQFYC